jgi:imidazolonepropionase-like amidohydrolase
MRTRTLVSLQLLVALAVAVRAQPPAQEPLRPVLVRAARLLDVRAGTYRINQGIWVDGGRIRQVAAFDEVRAAAPGDIGIIDLGRAAVLPGLIDVHAHLLAAMDPSQDPVDNLILTLTRLSPAARALIGAAMAREVLEGGFTTVRNVGHSGVDGDVSLRDAIRRGGLPGPRLVATGRKIAPYGGQAIAAVSGVGQAIVDLDFLPVTSPAEGRRAVLENLRVGADAIKVVADDGPRLIDEATMKAIVEEAHRANLRVAVHAETRPGIDSAIAAGADSIEHGNEATDAQFQAMRGKGITFVPTLWSPEWLPVSRALSMRPDIEALKAAYVAGEHAKLDRARKAGVTIAFGSDMWFAFPGRTRAYTTRQLLEGMQTAYRMAPADVLRSATVAAAGLLNQPNVTGAIEAGAFADLIAVDGDPLADVRDLEKTTFVMKGGAVIRDDLTARGAPRHPNAAAALGTPPLPLARARRLGYASLPASASRGPQAPQF